MKRNLTLPEYIANPMGDSTMTHRELYRELYSKKLDSIMEKRKQARIKYHIYTTRNDEYYIHFKIPSESTEELYYDIVFYFRPGNIKSAKHIKNHYVQFFSNDSMFNYVYAYVFNKDGLLIKDLKPKVSPYALKNPPDKTNKNRNVGYIKTIYLAYLVMEKYGLFDKVLLDTYGTPYNRPVLLNQVSSFDDKNIEYNALKSAQLERAREAKKALKREAEKHKPKSDNTVSVSKIGRIDKIQAVKRIGGVNDKLKTKKVGKIKKR